MSKKFTLLFVSILTVFCGLSPVQAELTPEVLDLQQRWAEVNYRLKDKNQIEAFNTLIEDARVITQAQAETAEAWLWSGIIRSSYAGAKGGLGALSAAKAAKVDLEKALELDPGVLEGAAYTSLGVLYLNVPGWPIAFGDDDVGVQLLKKGLEISPTGIDSNYFYAQYLYNEGELVEAQRYLLRALSADARLGRELADEGRRREIDEMLREVENQQ
ncbi:MAG: tetratricopeptide repeat protein [Gammaproteobacteria bacterium]